MDLLLAKVSPEEGKSRALRLSVHLDNCPVPSSKASKQYLDENSLAPVPHPPYSPDLPPSGFWLFGHIKPSFADRVFNDVDKFLDAAIEFSMRFGSLNCSLFFTTGSNE
jgi:hypothetical protein